MQAWEAEGTALIVSERLLNCPPQLAPPLHQALFEEEIPWATEDEPSQEARDSFGFARFLMASRVYADYSTTQQPSAAAERQAGAPKAKRKKVTTKRRVGSIPYKHAGVRTSMHARDAVCSCYSSQRCFMHCERSGPEF